ncbi:MAG: DUF4347 domain-containing protein, partial [Leptolyngbyaceae cyanobacterium SM2_5_2]|nr:DUF4347 domain-containing protein [Leptolyngbyaceae cyanobacterium SM2_5_2]
MLRTFFDAPLRNLAMNLELSTETLHPFQDGFYPPGSPLGLVNSPLEHGQTQHIAIIDSRVDDLITLVASINDAEVFILNHDQDGIEQISKILTNRQSISSLHVISHGSSGNIWLGNASLNVDSLAGYAHHLQAWGNSLTPDGDLLFYGCNVAANHLGKVFIEQVSQLAGADVAASTDLTGKADLGGDWEFEELVGTVETDGILSAVAQETYNGVLGTFSFANFTSTSGLRLNGNAGQAGTALRLTPAKRSQSGSAFSIVPIALTADTSFQTQFQFQLSGGTTGADGFAFVLQNNARGNQAIGSANGNLGLGGPQTGTRTRIDKSLAIEFDTFKNPWDPNNNHIAIVRDGRVNTP